MHKLRTKEDIEYHGRGSSYHGGQPAVNVKVYDTLSGGYKKWLEDNPDHDPRFTEDWIEENISDDRGSDIFWRACETRWEDLEWEAREIWGDTAYTDSQGRRRYAVNVYSEGRSGGWAIVDGINNDTDSWDAIEFNSWKRFAKFARGTADYIMWDVVDSIYCNEFEVWCDEQLELLENNAPAIPEGMRA